MYVCMHVCMYVYVYVCVCVCVCGIHASHCVCLYVGIYASQYVDLYYLICLRISVSLSVGLDAFTVTAHLSICMYVCMGVSDFLFCRFLTLLLHYTSLLASPFGLSLFLIVIDRREKCFIMVSYFPIAIKI